MKFQSKFVYELWDSVHSISQAEHPFLDPHYSPSTLMPASDYSKWVVSRLKENDWNSLKEFLNFLNYEHQITVIEKIFRNFSFSDYIDSSNDLLLELKAIAILCHRIQWTGGIESTTFLLSELFVHSLLCYPFEIREDSLDYLQAEANNLIQQQNKESEECGSDFTQAMVRIEELQEKRVFIPSYVGRIFGMYPVTFRACIGYSLDRGSPVIDTIRPQLQGEYGLRQFGLCSEHNAKYLDSISIFEAPSNLESLAKRLQKKELQEIGVKAGVEIIKSWNKDKMIESLMVDDAARMMIAGRASHELVVVRKEYQQEFDRWFSGVSSLKIIALCLASMLIIRPDIQEYSKY